MTWSLLYVALGGALGAAGRYLTGLATLRLMGPGFPWGTLFVNVLGSFLMGLLIVALADKVHERVQLFLLTGLLGGFTTFSAFSLEALVLYERGQPAVAGLYIAASLILSLGAVTAGALLARGL